MKEITELVFILDRSGSMANLVDDTIGSFNQFLQKQKAHPEETLATTVLFNHRIKFLHDQVTLEDVSLLSTKDYYVGGTTAMLDAIGYTLKRLYKRHQRLGVACRERAVLVVIMTDGMENSSLSYTTEDVRQLMHQRQTQDDWEFIFLGANIDAHQMGEHIGIRKDRRVNYHADKEGTRLNYEALSQTVSHFRQHRKVEDGWSEAIDRDYLKRQKNKE